MKGKIFRKVFAVFIAAGVLLLFFACAKAEPEPGTANSIRFEYQSIAICIDETRQLNIRVCCDGMSADEPYDTDGNSLTEAVSIHAPVRVRPVQLMGGGRGDVSIHAPVRVRQIWTVKKRLLMLFQFTHP